MVAAESEEIDQEVDSGGGEGGESAGVGEMVGVGAGGGLERRGRFDLRGAMVVVLERGCHGDDREGGN